MDKAYELCCLMYDAMPDEDVTLETLLDALSIMITNVIVNELDSPEEACDALQYVSGSIVLRVAAAEAAKEANWSDKGAMQ